VDHGGEKKLLKQTRVIFEIMYRSLNGLGIKVNKKYIYNKKKKVDLLPELNIRPLSPESGMLSTMPQ